MKSPTSSYFSELAKRRFLQDKDSPPSSQDVVADLKQYGKDGGQIGGNVLSDKRDRAFKKGNSARWRRYYEQHGLRAAAAPNLPPKQTGEA